MYLSQCVELGYYMCTVLAERMPAYLRKGVHAVTPLGI